MGELPSSSSSNENRTEELNPTVVEWAGEIKIGSVA